MTNRIRICRNQREICRIKAEEKRRNEVYERRKRSVRTKKHLNY